VALLTEYPASLSRLLATPPPVGEGHRWMFRVALHLRHYHTREACRLFLRRACDQCIRHRAIPDREIEAALSDAWSFQGDGLPSAGAIDWWEPDLARIAAVTRRFQGTTTAPLLVEFGPYRIDGASRELTRDGERIELQPKEFDLAWYLFLHRDRLVRREELVAAIWGRDLGGSARTLDTHLYTLRRKLMFAENGLRLSNVYREGYRLELAPAAAGASGD
jgi:hypothetical protein